MAVHCAEAFYCLKKLGYPKFLRLTVWQKIGIFDKIRVFFRVEMEINFIYIKDNNSLLVVNQYYYTLIHNMIPELSPFTRKFEIGRGYNRTAPIVSPAT